ncbi:RNA polymerase sigma factor [Fluviicola sp.]|uniref:RNA polymerase sigma factor n=1 Tax=Fluviicola sp. TaxID=1917219 RepID=UPI003D27C911
MNLTEDVISKFRSGDKKAFDQIYRAFSSAMYGICLRYTRCADDAQDVLQESFIKIYNNSHQYSSDHPLAGWVKSIVINTALTYIKQQYRFELHDSDNYFDTQQEPVIDEEDKELLKHQLLAFLTKLPDGYRTVFNLFVLENLTHKEIAEYLGISENTSKTQYFQAKRLIQQWLAEARHKTEIA